VLEAVWEWECVLEAVWEWECVLKAAGGGLGGWV
jgi:hypothetical protein